MMKRIIALLLALILTVGLLPTVALAAEGENPTTDSGSVTKEASKDNLNLVKTVTKEGDNYKVTLESWATGTVTSSSTPVPMDIILLLDQSGSMQDKFISSSTETYNKLNKSNGNIYEDYYNNCYIKSGEQYLKVTVTCQPKFGINNDVYTYTWDGKHITSKGAYNKPEIPLFYKSTTNSSTTRIAALKTAVSSFINKVTTEATTKNVDHRVAVVGFASTKDRSGNYKNTELLSTKDVVNYGSVSNIDYKNALVSATDKTRLSKAVDRLDANGDTYPEYGFDMANKIFAQHPIQDSGNRQRIVIMFTDGYPAPADTNKFNDGMANKAINNAWISKNTYNAKVYTIGIFTGADPAKTPSGNTEDDRANRYMHYSSSNYPQAQSLSDGGERGEGSYYLAASNADALKDIFDSISEEISTDTTTLDGSATIVDNIPGNFTIPAEASDIKVYTAKCTGKTGETLSWKERQASNLKPTTTTNTTTGVKSVSVTGFDYSDEWCGLDENNQPHGSKLIIEFTISHNNYGGTQPTNAGASIKDEENKDVITVDNPSVPVTITEPRITGASETKIYDGKGIDVIANIKAAADTLVTGANMGKNQFVTITVAVKVDKDTTYTYTIPAGAASGSWDPTTPTLTTGKDVNTYEYDLTITYTDATLKTDTTTPAEPKTASAKATYTITPAQVTLTSKSASKDYDGTALTKPEVTVGGAGATVFKNEVTDIKANGSVIDPGPAVTNTITYTPGANFKATNYNISKSEGKLSINDIAGPTNLPKVNVYCTNGVANHQESTGNTLKNNTYTSVVSKNAEGKYICTITLTDKSGYISDYNASTSATHTSDATRKDFTVIVLYYDTVNKAWPAPIVNFALYVKCDTPTVNVTYTWDGFDSSDFDTNNPEPTKPGDATPDKGSDYTVDSRYNNSSIAIGKDGVRYKFSGWSSATGGVVIDESGKINGIQTNVTLTGTWTKLGSGTFDLNDKIFKSFEKKQGSKDIPGDKDYIFEATVTRLDKENNNQKTSEEYTGTVTLDGATAAATPSFVFNDPITFHIGGEYRFLVEEKSNTVTALSSDERIDYDNAEYYLYVTVSDDLKTINYRFEHVLVITSAEEEPAATENQPITFHNYYYAAKDPGTYDINFSDLVFKILTKTGDRSFNGAEFTANVDGWRVHEIEIAMVRASAGFGFEPLNSVSLKAAFPADITFEVDGKAYRGFTGDTLTVTAGRYLFLIDEINDGQTNITYDESKYWLNLGFVENAEGEVSLAGQRVRKFVDGDTYETVLALENSEWRIVDTSISPVYFENTIDTGKDDYYPIIIPTIINKDTGMLNKTDHFAYVIGYPDGTVHPNGQITRAEVATIFFRLLRDEVRDGAFTTSNTYSDVAYGKWYNNPISTMSALGIITGYPDGTFKPNKPITRAEFAAIAARFDETQSGKSATFSDVIGHWAAKEIGIAYYNDWIKGYPDGTFKPDQNITRAEAMTLINRVLERKPESPADLLTNMNKWTDNMDTSKWYYLDVQEATNSHAYTRKTFNYELWHQMLPDPDWSRYER